MSTAIVTGASGSIGGAIVRLFAMNGIDVLINYRRNEASAGQLAEWVRQNTSASAITFCADISDEGKVAEMFHFCNNSLGRADILVNNAAISASGLLSDLAPGEWDDIFAINVKGAYLCAREALKSMIPQKRGKIVNISSIWGLTGASCEVAYSASKAAIIGFTKALAKEVGPSGIQVNCVAPGYIDTPMNSDYDSETVAEITSATPLARTGTPRDVAQSVLFLAGEGGDFITGQVLSPNGGLVI